MAKLTANALQTAQDVTIDVSGWEGSGKEILINEFLKHNQVTNSSPVRGSMSRPFTIENEKYNLKITSSTGQENLLGVSDVRYRAAQGCVFVYNIASHESFEQFQSTHEAILRVKEVDHFPLLLLGFYYGHNIAKERQVTTAQGQRLAERAGCQFVEILNPRKIGTVLTRFAEEIVHSSSSREKAKKAENARVLERYIGVIGDLFVGKSTMIKQISTGRALHSYKSTSSCAPVQWKFTEEDDTFSIVLVDTPGNATSFPRELFAKIQGLILVYSVTSRQSFEKIFALREAALTTKGISKLPALLVATKTDAPRHLWQVSEAEGKELSERLGCAVFYQGNMLETAPELTTALQDLLRAIRQSNSTAGEDFGCMNKTGQLNKTSKSLKKFKNKTYILSDGILHCTSDGVINAKSTLLPILEDTTVELLPTDPTKNIFPFEVSNCKGKMYLSATSDEDRASWVQSLVINIAVSNVGLVLIDDTIKSMLWEICCSPDLHEPDAEPETPNRRASRSRTGDLSTSSSSVNVADDKKDKGLRGFKRSSFSGLVRRKASGSSLLNTSVKKGK